MFSKKDYSDKTSVTMPIMQGDIPAIKESTNFMISNSSSKQIAASLENMNERSGSISPNNDLFRSGVSSPDCHLLSKMSERAAVKLEVVPQSDSADSSPFASNERPILIQLNLMDILSIPFS